MAVTDTSGDLYYVQKKDDGYYIKEFRSKYTFFGGGIKTGEAEYIALKRELREELEEEAVNIISISAKKLFDQEVINVRGGNHLISFYESRIDMNDLIRISLLPIKEGEKGVLLKRTELRSAPFIPDLKLLLNKYIK